jgi:outer membrane protein
MKHVYLHAVSLAIFLGLVAPPALAQQLKFAVVDVQRAVMETEDGLRAQATLKKFFDKRQQELDAKQTELQKQREEIEKQSKVISQQALQKRMEDWQKQMVELQTVFVEYNKELQKKQGELTQPIYGKIVGLLRRLATDRVIQMYNGGAAPASSAAPAAPAAAAPKPPTKP